MSALVHDGTAVLGRHLQKVRRAPAIVVMTQTMPIVFLLFFGYVFGSALAMPGTSTGRIWCPACSWRRRRAGWMTGMFQAAQDAHRGVMDRFRTMPMSRAAVPLGQALADLVTSAVGMVPMILVGLAMGWRIEGTALEALGAFGLLLLFRFATTWVGILLGLASQSEEAAGQLGSATFMLPLLSNAYIPTENMADWLRTVAEWNPISAVTTAVRELFDNATVPADAAWPVAHPVAGALLWSLALITVFAPLAVRRYARR